MFHLTTVHLISKILPVGFQSILGPLLFILYINDITFTSADDTTILYSDKNINEKISLIK